MASISSPRPFLPVSRGAWWLAVALAAGPVSADKPDRPWTLIAGVGALVKPEYVGADSAEARVLPLLLGEYELSERDRLFVGPDALPGYGHVFGERLSLGIKGSLRQGRDASDDRSLRGMPDIDTTLEVGPWAEYEVDRRWALSLETGVDVLGEHDGFVLEPGVSYERSVSKRAVVNLELAALYGSQTFVERYFSVAPEQSTGTRPAFAADAGFVELEVGAGIVYRLSKRVFARGALRYARLVGDAADSPLVQSEHQWRALGALGYRF